MCPQEDKRVLREQRPGRHSGDLSQELPLCHFVLLPICAYQEIGSSVVADAPSHREVLGRTWFQRGESGWPVQEVCLSEEAAVTKTSP